MEPTDENLRAFDRAHKPAEHGEQHLPQQVRDSLSDLQGKRVLHLGTGTGAATVEFVELGASVTGVDPDDPALELARERGPTVLWIHSELDALPTELQRGRFDLVYAGPETMQRVRDLDLLSGGIAASLRAGADLLVFDEHPAALCVDGLMHWREDYFAAGFRRLGQIVGALGRHGLVVRALEEYPAGQGTFHDARIPETFLLHARKAR
jgi:predicted TPR repeat methyltransferase